MKFCISESFQLYGRAHMTCGVHLLCFADQLSPGKCTYTVVVLTHVCSVRIDTVSLYSDIPTRQLTYKAHRPAL